MSPGDLPALIARHVLHRWKLAAELGIAPTRLSMLLHGRLALSPSEVRRIEATILPLARRRR